MKKEVKIYLEDSEEKALLKKAEEKGFVGRGALSHFMQMLASQPIVFLDKNLKDFISALSLKTA